MVSQKITITNAQGLHMRPAMEFAQAMAKFEADVNLKFNGSGFNGKSVINIMAGAMKCGSEIEVECSGPDEQEALAKAIEMIESGFGE